jgi:peptidyl-prolyl cis-trans isomerase B (cyclophilin B)
VAGNKDRQRRIARERHRRQQEVRQARRQKVRKRTLTVTGIVVGLGLVLGLVFAFAVPGSKPLAKSSASPSTTPSATATASATTVTEPATHCTYSAVSGVQVAKKETLPPATPDFAIASYLATIKTSVGTLKVRLLNSKATCTVNSFIHLAAAGYYSNTQCHRITTTGGLYVLQCGDAYATASTKLTCSQNSSVGSGGPGYQYANENTTGAKYTSGTVAMAHSSQPNSNGSQFFIVYKNSTLPADYTPFGTVSSGLNIVQNVAKDGLSCTFGSPGDGAPKQKVIIDSVAIQKT